ncbi:MAG: GLPGLI family protein [Gemmatimonadota bacterium]|nr:GLPGLI family protein [Gemmatimonadota bacterium]
MPILLGLLVVFANGAAAQNPGPDLILRHSLELEETEEHYIGNPLALFVAPDGSLLVSDGFAETVLRYDATGRLTGHLGGRGGGPGEFHHLGGVGFVTEAVAGFLDETGRLELFDPMTGAHHGRVRVDVSADGQSGTISYASSVSLDVEMPGELAEVPAVLEAWGSAPFLLHFTPSRSLMVRERWNRGGGVAPARFRATGTTLNALGRALEAWYAFTPSALGQAYVGEDGSSAVKVLDVGRTRFRIAEGVVPVAWTITEQHGEHLGYRVTRAVGEAADHRVEAWFAPDIPVSFGPALYGGLPGMILALSVNEGVTTYTATEVVLEAVEDGLIRVPEDGEAISSEEYRSYLDSVVPQMISSFRDMTRWYTNVECIVGWQDNVLLQCKRVRGDWSR